MTNKNEIERLIEAQDIWGLIDRVASLPYPSLEQARSEPLPLEEEDLNKAKEFLGDHIHQVICYLSVNDSNKRCRTVRVLGELQHPESVSPLIKQLLTEKDEWIRGSIVNYLITNLKIFQRFYLM